VSYRGARVLVHCVKDAGHLDAMFAMLRYHPFLANSVLALPGRHHPPLSYRHPNHLRRPYRWAPDFRVKLGRLSIQDRRYEMEERGSIRCLGSTGRWAAVIARLKQNSAKLARISATGRAK
jgi:hypothetical protein